MGLKEIIIILLVVFVAFGIYFSKTLQREYKKELERGLVNTISNSRETIEEEDIENLPNPVQKYLRYVGVLGKEKVKNFRIEIDGQMKMDRNKDFQDAKIEQYTFQDDLTRLFYMEMKVGGLPIKGLHAYKDGEAIMDIRALGIIPVAKGQGEKMNEAETVTIFNDMCIFAPATLIDKRIKWEEIDDKKVKAYFTNGDITIQAMLYFNEEGQLINFTSDNRYYSPKGDSFDNLRWSTPITEYDNFNGYNLPSYGEAYWSFPDEDFTYIKLNIKKINYNVK